MLRIIICLYVLMASFSVVALSNKVLESHKTVSRIANIYLDEKLSAQFDNYKINIGSLDTRLKLNLCPNVPKAFIPNGYKLETIRSIAVKCDSENIHWVVYVPVKISFYTLVVASLSELRRGMIIGSNDIYLENIDTKKLHFGFFTKESEVIGREVTKSIHRNESINKRNSKLVTIIKRGQEVTIVVKTNNLNVKAKGVALENAKKGDLIKVKNTQSKRIIEGIAIKPGLVKIPF